ncbi:MAG: exodeoxyribonuclease III [Gammaproteobacteria bacterium]
MKIATWNVNSLRVRLPHILNWLDVVKPGILALQETKVVDEEFPVETFKRHGYQAVFSGQKTYNGVAILSRDNARNVNTTFPAFPDPQRRILLAKVNTLSVLNLYVPNGSEVGSEKYAYKLEWLSHLLSYIDEQLEQNENLVVLGDFNIAPADADVHDPEAWRGKVLVSGAEREAFFQLTGKGLMDCYRLFEHEEQGFSWWDYRAGSFRRNRGLRIDHILASTALARLCMSCRIDKAPRRLQRPSDHAPVVAEFNI